MRRWVGALAWLAAATSSLKAGSAQLTSTAPRWGLQADTLCAGTCSRSEASSPAPMLLRLALTAAAARWLLPGVGL